LVAGASQNQNGIGRIFGTQDTTKKKSHHGGTLIIGAPKRNPITNEEKARQDSILGIPNKVFTSKKVNLGAEPRGGSQAFRKWLQDNVQFSKEAHDRKIKGIVK